ncbi:hypothetical protein ATANTOWER_031327 [Ataeniobius toweri]|uniref:Uncharacterized protein n=1 Tax=Ataeniobius toweri TaxID=208326 RepID=A0ABU7A8P1_9TELE|nr:hypothetical protein [Ataeniobius toweri]
MARAVHREPAEFNMDYVNLPDSSVRMHANKGNQKPDVPDPLRKLFRLVGVGFGLLCILQAALNVSLRLTLYVVPLIQERQNCEPCSEFFSSELGWKYRAYKL